MTREQREIIRKQIDALMRERLGGEPSPRGPRHQGNAPKTHCAPRRNARHRQLALRLKRPLGG